MQLWKIWFIVFSLMIGLSQTTTSTAREYLFKDILTQKELKARHEKSGGSSIQTLGNTIAATTNLSNDRLDLFFTEQNSDVWKFLYDVAGNAWGESCWSEHFGIWTPASGILESENFTVQDSFSDPGGQAGTISAVLTSGDFEITRTISLQAGDIRFFQIKYIVKNTSQTTIDDVRFFETIDFDIPITGDHTDDYGWYESSTDYIGIKDDEFFRNGITSNIRSSAHGMALYSTELYDDWDDGQLNGADSYGPGDPAIGKQFNIGSMSPGQTWEVILTIWFGNYTAQEENCRVWIDKNNNNQYDDGEGVDSADVWVNNVPKGQTGSEGTIQLDDLNDNDDIYAYKQFYNLQNPKSGDTNFGDRDHNPYYASNATDGVNGVLYNFVMASDIMGADGQYYDFPGQGNDLQDAPRDGDGNILVELVHPKIEWNLTLAFETKPSISFLNEIKTGIRKFANFVYDYTDGYSVIRNVVLINGPENGGPFSGTAQWDYTNVKVMSSDVRANAHVGGMAGIRYNQADCRIQMGNKNPDGDKWAATIGHEAGHYMFAFYDEYINGDDTGRYKSDANDWTYRYEHDGDWKVIPPWEWEPDEFPKNFGLMDHQSFGIEMSDCTDYFTRANPWNVDHVTYQLFERNFSCWQYFEDEFETEINGELATLGFSTSFSDSLIVPPHSTGSYPDSNSDKRPKPNTMNHNSVNIIDWNCPADATTASVSAINEIFDAVIQVVDQENKPVKGAAVWLVSGDIKTLQGKTDASGQVESRSLRIGKNIAAFYEGRKTVLPVDNKSDTFELVIPLTIPSSESKISDNALVQAETDVPGIVVSMKPDNSGSSASIKVSGDPLSAAPDTILSQPPSYSNSVSMTASGTNEYSGTASLEGRSGNLDVTASTDSQTNEALCPFYVYDTTENISPGFTSQSGDLVMSKTASSFSGEGMLAILTSMSSVPKNGDLVHIGHS